MAVNIKRTNLEKIARKMTSSLRLAEVLTAITQGLVDEVDAAFARIWLTEPGDICEKCDMRKICPEQAKCLHLKASSGIYTRLDGEFRRVPLGSLKIGRIASEQVSVCTNQVAGDGRFQNQAWVKTLNLRSFAGYPLVFRQEVLGVICFFSQRKISESEFKRLAVFADQAATAIKNARLFQEVERLNSRLVAENTYLHQEIRQSRNPGEMIGKSEGFGKVLSLVKKVADTDATVLITGETGTGKELIAHAVHSTGPRKNHPLVRVNCAALPGALIENELFGHEAGAYTGAAGARPGRFEIADQGTLFLDEIGELKPELQSKLLRAIQEGTFERVGGTKTIRVDVRIIAATNADLQKAVARREFRQDLFFRLNVFPIHLPPLRERAEDITELAMLFAARYAAKYGKPVPALSPALRRAFAAYDWPGNIRELENVMERAVIVSEGEGLLPDDVFPLMPGHGDGEIDEEITLKGVERSHILKMLERRNWVIEGPRGAARVLDIHPATLRSRMKKLGIKRPVPEYAGTG